MNPGGQCAWLPRLMPAGNVLALPIAVALLWLLHALHREAVQGNAAAML